jgi:ABC-type phosphate transport system substrate-binding protein
MLVFAACGSDDNSTRADDGDGASASTVAPTKVACASGTISGAGSTFVQTNVQQWIKDYAAACPDATVNYQGVGSGAGIQQLTAGTVDFAGSDVAMKPEEQTAAEAKVGPVLHIPWTAGGIAVEYHLDGVTAAVKQTAGAIGYAEVSFAKGGSLGIAKIENAKGSFVGPEADAVAAALESATVPGDLKVQVSYAPDSADAYPISTTSFVIVPAKPADTAKGKLLQSFVSYALGRGQDAAEDLFYAPLPSSLQTKAATAAEGIGG